MNQISKILKSVPFFRHLTSAELLNLDKVSRVVSVKKGQLFDLKKTASLNIVLSGMFEIETTGRTDIVYLSPGSFFGSIPFTDQRQRGAVRALSDASIIILDEDRMYPFFISSFKALRGYVNILKRLNLTMNDAAKRFFSRKTRMMCVYSPYSGAGKTFFSSLIGAALSSAGKTIILDLNYSGKSLFDCFQKNITSPVSHRKAGDDSAGIIRDRITGVSDNLDLLNVTFGSRVRVDPDIVSPVLTLLSYDYDFIIMDVSDGDLPLRDMALENSDTVFCMQRKEKEFERAYSVLDSCINEAQRVYYIINEHAGGSSRCSEGSLVLEDLSSDSGIDFFESAQSVPVVRDCVELFTSEKKALVLESALYDSVFAAGLLSYFDSTDFKFDLIYSSAFTYIVSVLFLLSEGDRSFEKKICDFFSESRFNSFLDVTFPDEFLFRGSAFMKYAAEEARNRRAEFFRSLPVALIGSDNDENYIMRSTGNIKDLMNISFRLYPFFDDIKTGKNRRNSGYPGLRCEPEDLLRTDVNSVTYAGFINRGRLSYPDQRVLSFYERYISSVEPSEPFGRTNLADDDIILDFSENELKPDRLFKISEKAAEKLLKAR